MHVHATSVTGKNASIRIPCIPIGMQRARACVCVTNVQQSFKKTLVFIENVNNKVNKTSGESRTLSSTYMYIRFRKMSSATLSICSPSNPGF